MPATRLRNSRVQMHESSWAFNFLTFLRQKFVRRLVNEEEHSSATSVNPPAMLAWLSHHCRWPFWYKRSTMDPPSPKCTKLKMPWLFGPRLKSLCSSVTACSSSGSTSPPDMMAYSKPGAMADVGGQVFVRGVGHFPPEYSAKRWATMVLPVPGGP